jgi:hypothetical protein
MGRLEDAPVFACGPEQVPHSSESNRWPLVRSKGTVSLKHNFFPHTSYSCEPASARCGALCSGSQLLIQIMTPVPSFPLSRNNSSLEQTRRISQLQTQSFTSCVCVVWVSDSFMNVGSAVC